MKTNKSAQKREQRFRDSQRNNSKKALGLAGAVGAGAVALGASASQAEAGLIGSFSELLAPGYTVQNLTNSPAIDFKVDGETPVLDYHFGFLDENGFVVGYLENYHPVLRDLLGGKYNGDPNVPGYENVLNVGEKPHNVIVIEDTDGDGVIGDLTGGVFTVDAEDFYWLKNDIEFAGTQGAISEMPAYTGTSDTLTVPEINLVPEPTSLAILGIGAAAILGKKIKGLIGKLFN